MFNVYVFSVLFTNREKFTLSVPFLTHALRMRGSSKVFYPLLLTPFADKDSAVLLADDVIVKSLKDNLFGIFRMDYAIVAFMEVYVSDKGIVIFVFI